MSARIASWLLLGCVLAFGPAASASTSIALPFESLLRQSTYAALVTPVTQTSLWEDGRIVTYTVGHVDASVAGNLPEGDVWVRTLGGEVGRVGQVVAGEAVLTVGHPCLLFLRPAVVLRASSTASDEPTLVIAGVYAITGRAQGEFPVIQDDHHDLRVTQSFGADGTLPPRGLPAALLASDALHGLRLEDAKSAVAGAWGDTHGH